MTKALVWGGRDYSNRAHVYRTLDDIVIKHALSLIIQTEAVGADRLASMWAEERGVPTQAPPADIARLANRAVDERNAYLLDRQPDLLVIFPGVRGVSDMLRQAADRGVAVIRADAS